MPTYFIQGQSSKALTHHLRLGQTKQHGCDRWMQTSTKFLRSMQATTRSADHIGRLLNPHWRWQVMLACVTSKKEDYNPAGKCHKTCSCLSNESEDSRWHERHCGKDYCHPGSCGTGERCWVNKHITYLDSQTNYWND